jgi:hypothetical protein
MQQIHAGIAISALHLSDAVEVLHAILCLGKSPCRPLPLSHNARLAE